MMSERPSTPRFQLRFRDLLIVTALVAVFLGIFAPELRSWDKKSPLMFGIVGAISVLVFVSFWPVWVVLLWLRRRRRRGLSVSVAHVILAFGSYALSLGCLCVLLCVLLWTVKWLVIR